MNEGGRNLDGVARFRQWRERSEVLTITPLPKYFAKLNDTDKPLEGLQRSYSRTRRLVLGHATTWTFSTERETALLPSIQIR